MHNLTDDQFDQQAEAIQPWLAMGYPWSDAAISQQQEIRERLTRKAGAKFSANCFVLRIRMSLRIVSFWDIEVGLPPEQSCAAMCGLKVTVRYIHIITPLPLTGIAGAKLFDHHALCPDLIYINGDHEYETAIFEIRSWLGLLPERGAVIGGDVDWPGVKRAIMEIIAEGVWMLEVREKKFILFD